MTGHLVGLLGAVSAGAAIGVFGIGSLVLAGWTFDIPVLKSFDPDLVPMKANTASMRAPALLGSIIQSPSALGASICEYRGRA
jgi:hypothetical protein